MYHTGGSNPLWSMYSTLFIPLGFEINMALINIRMPLYFSLSGFFFKRIYEFHSDFVVRKVNKLIVPYVFFAIFPIRIAVFVIWPETIPQNTQGIYIPVTPCYRAYEWHAVVFKSVVPNLSVVLPFHRISHSWPVVGRIDGYAKQSHYSHIWEQEAGNKHLENNTLNQWIWLLNIPMAFMALPYFYVAEFLRNHNILSMKFPIWKTIVGVVLFLAICLLT